MMAKKEKKKSDKADKKAEKKAKAAKKSAKKSPKKSAKKKKVVKSKDPIEVQKQRWTVYTTMSLITMMAIIFASLCLHLELKRFDYKLKPTASASNN